jgi:hypothetical protein
MPGKTAAMTHIAEILDSFIWALRAFNIANIWQLQTLAEPVASCNRQSKIYNLNSSAGVLAQLVERLNGIEEVTGSNPVGSIYFVVTLSLAARPVTGALLFPQSTEYQLLRSFRHEIDR